MMWYENRFVATRDPSRGGLCITAATEGFSEQLKTEIYEDCLEMAAKDYGHSSGGIYPLLNGQYAIMMAKKVSGSSRESRPHEIIRGVIADADEMAEFCEGYIAEGNAEAIFFPDAPDPDHPEDWYMRPDSIKKCTGRMKTFLDHLDYQSTLGLVRALQDIKKKKERIQLIVRDGSEWMAMAVCCCMAVQAGVRLFVMANGECTLTPPDIVISDQLFYLDERDYQKVTMEQLIHMGNVMGREAAEAPAAQEPDEAEELLRFCSDYLTSGNISDDELYEAMEELMHRDRSAFFRFRRKMKGKLFHFRNVSYCKERYMKLLYAVFKKPVQEEMNDSLVFCPAPYDFHGMYLFLKKKAGNKREFRRLLAAMLELQFAGEMDAAWNKAAHNASMNILDIN